MRSFLWINKMATDIDVQFFSHLNGLTLGNNWGDMIRLLDKALVTGIDFTQITAASIDAQGDLTLTFYAAHNALLFQIVELSGFVPGSLNQKYRIKGVPNTTQLILKAAIDIAERSITTIGAGRLASLGYDIIFRDTNDVKRVYRAKNPTTQHPFIRVDETISDGANSYASTYAKYAMVGLLEHMDHIDDYSNSDLLQLPFEPATPSKNWGVSGTGSTVKRGWSRWYWRRSNDLAADSVAPASGNAAFTLCGDNDAFYLLRALEPAKSAFKTLVGCGLYNSALYSEIVPNWFLMTRLLDISASTAFIGMGTPDGDPLMRGDIVAGFYTPTYNPADKLKPQKLTKGVLPDYNSGLSGVYGGSNLASLQIPIVDDAKILRGTLKTITYAGNNLSSKTATTPIIGDNSMYVWDSALGFSNGVDTAGGFYFYLGELE